MHVTTKYMDCGRTKHTLHCFSAFLLYCCTAKHPSIPAYSGSRLCSSRLSRIVQTSPSPANIQAVPKGSQGVPGADGILNLLGPTKNLPLVRNTQKGGGLGKSSSAGYFGHKSAAPLLWAPSINSQLLALSLTLREQFYSFGHYPKLMIIADSQEQLIISGILQEFYV